MRLYFGVNSECADYQVAEIMIKPVKVIDRFSCHSGQMNYLNAVVHLDTGATKIVAIGWLGLLGVQTGINGNGIFATSLNSPVAQSLAATGRRSLSLDMRKALETGNTLTAVAEYLQDGNKTYGFSHNIFLADRSRAMVLENDFDALRALRDETSILNPGVAWGIGNALACVNSFVLAGNHDNHTPTAVNVARWESFKTQLAAAGDQKNSPSANRFSRLSKRMSKTCTSPSPCGSGSVKTRISPKI